MTISEVARRLGMRAPSLFKYFPSGLHALYDALFARGVEEADAAIHRAAGGMPPGAARLRARGRGYVRWAVENAALAQLLHVGARFAALNKTGRGPAWTNHPVVTVAEPGQAFAVSSTEKAAGTIEVDAYRSAHHGPPQSSDTPKVGCLQKPARREVDKSLTCTNALHRALMCL